MRIDGPGDRVIKPGQNDKLVVTLYGTVRPGELSKAIAVSTNDPANKDVKLWCKGDVRGAFSELPGYVRFGPLERTSGPQTKTIVLKRGSGGPIKPEGVPLNPKLVKTEVREITPGEHYELDITLTPPWPNKRIVERVAVKTGLSEVDEHFITATADVTPRVRTTPERFSVLAEQPDSKEHSVELAWEHGPAHKLLGAQVSDSRLSAGIEEKDGTQRVFLKVPAEYRQNGPAPEVILQTDDPELPEFTIAISVVRPPDRNLDKRSMGRRMRPAPGRAMRPGAATTRPARPGRMLPPQRPSEAPKSAEPDKPAPPEKPTPPDKAPQPEKPKDEGT